MVLTKSTAKEKLASVGNIRIFVDSAGKACSPIVIVDDDGNQIGISTAPLSVVITDGVNAVTVDAIHSALEIIQSLHHATHEGRAYEVSRIFEDVADDAHADMLIKVGTTKELHIVIFGCAGGDAYIRIYEGTTVSADGTAITPRNKNRNWADSSNANFYYGPTVTGVGTLLNESYVPGGAGGIATGGAGRDIEFGQNFKKDTNYLVRVTNKAGLAKTSSIWCTYYEVE